MSEVLRELVVALSLDSDNFSRNMRTINKQIKEAESTFTLASAGVDKFEKTIKGAEAKLSMLGSKLTQQNRAVEQYSRALVAANQKLTDSHARQEKMTAALAQARTEVERTKQQVGSAATAYRHYASTLGESDSATIAAKDNLERCKEEFKDARDKVKLLEGQLKSNAKTLQNNADAISTTVTNLNNAKAAVKETEAEIKKLTEELYRMQSKWTQAGEALTAFSKKCDTVSKAMVSAGKGMTHAITTPILALGTAAVKASIDYESAFTSVRKTVDATEAEFASLSDSIKQMSTQVASSGSDIAEVVAVAGQLGIQNEHLMEFARTMIDLGNSTDIVADDAAATLAKFANIMSMDQSLFQNLGSALVDLGNNYATTESAIMEMAMRLAGAGHQVGLSEAQILGFATALSSVGIEAQMGGSAFSKALVKMEVAAETGGDALKDFAMVSGMTAEQFKALWKADPAGAFQTFIVGLSKMDDEGESAIATLEEIGIKNASDVWTDYPTTADNASITGGTLNVKPTHAVFVGDCATLRVLTSEDGVTDVMTIYKVRDGATGASGGAGASAPMAFLTNENITFAGNVSGQVAAVTKTCNVVAYNGTNKVTPTVGTITGAPSGMTVTKGNAANNEVPISIAITANATLGGAGAQQGTLSVPITAPVSTTLLIHWSKVNTGATGAAGSPGAAGQNAVVFSLYAPNGSVFLNQTGSLTIQSSAFDGTIAISSGATYVWKKYVSGSWTAISGQTGASLSVAGSTVNGVQAFQCTMTYGGKTYTDTLTLTDKSDNYQATIESSGGDVFKNGIGSSTLLCRLFQNGQEVDAAGTAYTYKWYRRDKDGNALDSGAVFATGKSVAIDGDDVDIKTTFTCEIE